MSRDDARLVVNTSPLIHLAEADLLHLLLDAAPKVWVPAPVAVEIGAHGDQDPTTRALAAHDWLEVRPVEQVAVDILAWDLGPGESAVLELTRTYPGSTAVIDAGQDRILVTHDMRTMPLQFASIIQDHQNPGVIVAPQSMRPAQAAEEQMHMGAMGNGRASCRRSSIRESVTI